MSDAQTRRQFLGRAGRMGLAVAGLALLGGCAVGQGQGSGAAPATRVATIGILARSGLGAATDESQALYDLRQGLHELGWVDGQNVRLEIRTWEGELADLQDAAVELARVPVDIIVTQGPTSARAARGATGALPIVMMQGPDDVVAQGLAASIQRPGGNVTGLLGPPPEIFGKRLELLVEALPHVSRVASVGPPGPGRQALEETARALGVQVQFIHAQGEQDLNLAFEVLTRDTADAVLIQNGPVTNSNRARILDFLAWRQLPAMFESRDWSARGGLLSYGNNSLDTSRRAATYVDRILRGAKPGDLPIEYPTRYDFIIELKTAATLGITIPDSALAQATEVIR